MKITIIVLTILLFQSCASAKPIIYQGSTPAHAAIREFLNISRTDSIDFIRWKLVIDDNRFTLNCRYGISKPNTNGFIDEHKVDIAGSSKFENHQFELKHDKNTFFILEINTNLVHLLDQQKNLLVGNGGWSFTLNNVSPESSARVFFPAKQATRETSMAFEGRTPCRELSQLLGINSGPDCIKLKWYMILYRDAATGKPTNYRIGGTALRNQPGRTGKWEMTTTSDGRTVYRLDPGKKEKAIHLLTAGDTILLFTDATGNLLVGNEDFSYTLNRTNEREGPLKY